MTSPYRRDWLLQQLGLTQWVLRRPAVLQGEVAITLPAHTRLVMIARQLPALTDPLVSDVLRSLGLNSAQVFQVTPDSAAMLPADKPCNSWCLGTDVQLSLPGAKLQTPALDELYHNGAARQALWRQICEHEHDFFPESR